MKRKTRTILITAGSVVALGAMCLATSFTTVHSGEVGVSVKFGKASNVAVSEGLYLKVPFIERVVKMNVKVQKLEVETASSSKDLQEVEMTIAVNYNVEPEQAVVLYKTVGSGYEQIILRPSIEESIKAVTAKYTAEQLITRRSEVSDACMEELSKKVEKYGLSVKGFNITNFDFSSEFARAIEEKQVAEQKVLTAKQELERDKINAEKIIVAAEAEKQANELKSESLTPEILLESAIEKWDGKLPEYVGVSDDLDLTKILK